jgi:hypothetical protein
MKLFVFVFASLVVASTVQAQSTVFTYQGRLEDAGAAADGPHDLRFRLFDAAAGGSQVGATQCLDGVDVVDGLFTVQLDFGQQFATLVQRHLDIQVRRDIGQPCTDDFGYVLLSPRQALTATPRAQAANVANALAAPDGSPASAVFVDSDGKVGIGTTTPQSILHVAGWQSVFDAPGGAIRVTKTLGQLNSDDLGIWNRGGSGGQPFAIADWNTGTRGIFLNTTSGNVGIGTTAPAAKLDVRGDIRLGSSGQFFAPAAGENLRLVRGDVRGGDGAILRGAGFTVQRVSDGVYDIFFTPAFSAAPTVTVTAHAYERTVSHAPFFLSASRARVLIQANGSLADTDFSMCVIGPR